MNAGAESPQAQSRYARLPEPISPEDMRTSLDVHPAPDEEKDDYWREVEWMLKVTGGG